MKPNIQLNNMKKDYIQSVYVQSIKNGQRLHSFKDQQHILILTIAILASTDKLHLQINTYRQTASVQPSTNMLKICILCSSLSWSFIIFFVRHQLITMIINTVSYDFANECFNYFTSAAIDYFSHGIHKAITLMLKIFVKYSASLFDSGNVFEHYIFKKKCSRRSRQNGADAITIIINNDIRKIH